MIKTQKMTKSYDNVFAIKDVSLKLNKGEIFGFIGPNGAGKSTSIKALLNYIFLDSGSAEIMGLDIVDDNKEIKKHLGYVSSEVNFYPNLTGLEMIQLALDLHGLDHQAEMNRLIDLFLIERDKKMKNLSLGNKKKIAIVSALVLNPPLLILDEPTNGLDPLMQNVLFEELKRRRDNGVTVFISSHNLKEVQDHCNRVAFIRKGEIIQVANIDERLREGKYVRVKGDVETIKEYANQILMEKENELSFVYTGNLNHLINKLSKLKIENLIVEDLSIEHQFLEFYSKKEEEA